MPFDGAAPFHSLASRLNKFKLECSAEIDIYFMAVSTSDTQTFNFDIDLYYLFPRTIACTNLHIYRTS